MGTLAKEDRGDDGQDIEAAPTKLSLIVGENLRRLRRKRGLSLEQLSHRAGVSRAMLGQIETGKSAPTINLLGRIAQALGVTVPSLISLPDKAATIILPRDRCAVVTSSEGQFTCRALFPWGEEQRAEFYELTVAPRHRELANAGSAGAKKTLVVASGEIEVSVGTDSPARLSEGDTILFCADVEHSFYNPGNVDAKAFLVVTTLEAPAVSPNLA